MQRQRSLQGQVSARTFAYLGCCDGRFGSSTFGPAKHLGHCAGEDGDDADSSNSAHELRSAVETAAWRVRTRGGHGDIPAGGATSVHQHPWSRFAYVEKGRLRVINHDTGEAKDFRPGEVLSEAVGQWHEGRAIDGPVRLIVFDVVPPGVTNVTAEPVKK